MRKIRCLHTFIIIIAEFYSKSCSDYNYHSTNLNHQSSIGILIVYWVITGIRKEMICSALYSYRIRLDIPPDDRIVVPEVIVI